MTALRYNNTSTPVVLVSGISDVDDTLTVGSTASYPDAPFLLGVDRGTSDEEVMLCTAKTSTTFTVTRGYDGTTAVSHNIGAIVEHASAAISHRRGGIAQVTTAERDALASVDLWNGRTIWNTDTSKLQYYTGSGWANVGPRTGAIEAFAGSSAPVGTLLCNGQSVSRATYADLFASISTTFGVGDGSTTFDLPDLRQKFPVGAQSGGDYDLGDTGGAETVALSTSEMPSHTHTGPSHTHSMASSHDHNIGNHSHTLVHTHNSGNLVTNSHNSVVSMSLTGESGSSNAIEFGVGSAASSGTIRVDSAVGVEDERTTGTRTRIDIDGNTTHNIGGTTSGASVSNTGNSSTGNTGSTNSGSTNASGTAATGSTGSGNAHENRPPFIALHFVIYT